MCDVDQDELFEIKFHTERIFLKSLPACEDVIGRSRRCAAKRAVPSGSQFICKQQAQQAICMIN